MAAVSPWLLSALSRVILKVLHTRRVTVATRLCKQGRRREGIGTHQRQERSLTPSGHKHDRLAFPPAVQWTERVRGQVCHLMQGLGGTGSAQTLNHTLCSLVPHKSSTDGPPNPLPLDAHLQDGVDRMRVRFWLRGRFVRLLVEVLHTIPCMAAQGHGQGRGQRQRCARP